MLVIVNHNDPPNIISTTINATPYCLRKFLRLKNLSDKKLNNIQEPSSGGIGIRLKTASQILIEIIKLNVIKTPGLVRRKALGINLKSVPKIIASKMFDAGPATETFISPYFLSLKL